MSRIGRIGDWNNRSEGNSGSSSRSGSTRRIATFNEMVSGRQPGRHDDDESDEEQDSNDRRETWFAGGERSGVAIQNPDRAPDANNAEDIIRDLLAQARAGGVHHPPEAPASRFFTGGGHTLGSDEVESTYVPGSNAQGEEPEEVVRHLHLWRNGFSVEDGPLMSYVDDRDTLELIQSGRAPPDILNVTWNQPVQLVIGQRKHEDYIPPKAGAFSGSGNRLGSQVPAAEPTPSMPGGFQGESSAPAASSSRAADSEGLTTRFEVDQSKPMTSVQIRLADGTRMVARVNLTHTVADLRNFINASRPGTSARPYTIATPVPYKALDDDKLTIEEAGLKNSVVVQRWTDA